MITDEQFEKRMLELFHQLGDEISTVGDPNSILGRRPEVVSLGRVSAPSDACRGRWVAVVVAVSLVGLGVAAVATRDGPVHRISPAAATDSANESAPTVVSVGDTIASTAPQTQAVVSQQSTTSSISMQQDPYGDVDTMLQAAQDIYYRAMVNAVTDCMLIQGYTYQSVPDPAYNLTDFLTRHPWNSPTSEVAAVRGYLLPGQGVPVDNPDGDSGLGNDAYQHALYGDVIDNWELGPGETVPEGFAVGGPIMDGCRPTAQRAIQGVGDPRAAWRIFDYFYQMQGIESPATHEITSNPDYQLAVTAWSACMKEAGYDYTTLEQPPNDGWSSPRPGPAEVATATADASCKASSGLTNLGDQLFDQITTDWFSQHPTSYAEITDYVKGVTDRSTAILES